MRIASQVARISEFGAFMIYFGKYKTDLPHGGNFHPHTPSSLCLSAEPVPNCSLSPTPPNTLTTITYIGVETHIGNTICFDM